MLHTAAQWLSLVILLLKSVPLKMKGLSALPRAGFVLCAGGYALLKSPFSSQSIFWFVFVLVNI